MVVSRPIEQPASVSAEHSTVLLRAQIGRHEFVRRVVPHIEVIVGVAAFDIGIESWRVFVSARH